MPSGYRAARFSHLSEHCRRSASVSCWSSMRTAGASWRKGFISAAAPPLSWDELSGDLRRARRLCADLHVFSLEGCVRQGFLPRLQAFDWGGPGGAPKTTARRMELMRRAGGVLLRACALLLR